LERLSGLVSALLTIGISSEFFRVMSSIVSFVSWGGADLAGSFSERTQPSEFIGF
jgi:hypothetical protein